MLMDRINRAHALIDENNPAAALEVLGDGPGELPQLSYDGAALAALAEFYRGLAHDALDEGPTALSCIRRALAVLQPEKIQPDKPGALASLLSICADAGRIEFRWGRRLRTIELSRLVVNAHRAANDAERAQVRPHYAQMTFDSGAIALELDMPGIARLLLQEALGSFSSADDTAGVYRACIALASCEEEMGHRELAMQFVHRAQELDDTAQHPTELPYLIVKISLHDGNIIQARQILQELDERDGPACLHPTTIRRTMLWTELLRQEGRLNDAISVITSALTPDVPTAMPAEYEVQLRLKLALLLGQDGQLARAGEEGSRAWVAAESSGYDERRADIAAFLAGVLLLTGDADTAYSWARAAVAAAPSLRVRFGGLGYSDFVRRDGSLPSGVGLLPLAAAESGRTAEVLLGLLRLRFEVRGVLQRTLQVLSQRSAPPLLMAEYEALHLGIDLARSLPDAYRNPELISRLEHGIAAAFNEISRVEDAAGAEFDPARAADWMTTHGSDTAYVFLYPEQIRLLAGLVYRGTTTAVFLEAPIEELRTATEAFWRDMRDIGIEGAQLLQFFSTELWAPLHRALTANGAPLPARLAFLPFGWTQLLPLQLLTDIDGEPLLTRYDMHRIPFADMPRGVPKRARQARLLFVAPSSAQLPSVARERAAAERAGLRVDTLEGSECSGERLAQVVVNICSSQMAGVTT